MNIEWTKFKKDCEELNVIKEHNEIIMACSGTMLSVLCFIEWNNLTNCWQMCSNSEGAPSLCPVTKERLVLDSFNYWTKLNFKPLTDKIDGRYSNILSSH